MNHQHSYGFWHKHAHKHVGEEHEHAHCHFWVTVHDHGPVTKVHTHKTQGFHPPDDDTHQEHHGREMAIWEKRPGQ